MFIRGAANSLKSQNENENENEGQDSAPLLFLPISFIKNNNLMPTGWQRDFLLRESLDSIAHDVDALIPNRVNPNLLVHIQHISRDPGAYTTGFSNTHLAHH
jgi:hypothetical protein